MPPGLETMFTSGWLVAYGWLSLRFMRWKLETSGDLLFSLEESVGVYIYIYIQIMKENFCFLHNVSNSPKNSP